MSKTIELRIPVNRVEGDLDIEIKIEDNIITQAKSIGTLYRGFENILKGRDPLDSLVITPRVCGICSVSHLTAAVKALENAYNITPPKQAIRLRNISILSENLQSDLRHIFLMFMSDFTNEYYKNFEFFELANKLYAPFKGEFTKKTLDITKEIVKIIAYIGGQWPHTSHMVPGGLAVISDDLEVLRIKFLLNKIKKWYEDEILNSSIEEFSQIKSFDEFKDFINKNKTSQIAIFSDILFKASLHNLGASGYGFINVGSMDLDESQTLVPQCIVENGTIKNLDINKIKEDVTYSYYEEFNSNNMYESKTIPNLNKQNAYSLAKAPRYNDKVYQTGPLGEELALKNPLITDIYNKFSDSVFTREIARLLRGVRYIKFMLEEIENVIKNLKAPLYSKPKKIPNTTGVGFTHAARGALSHFIKIVNGKIKNYQIISPTTWNGSPKDSLNQPGPWEKALLNLKIKNIDNPVELGHVIRSFDPCLVCTVHFIGDENKRLKINA